MDFEKNMEEKLEIMEGPKCKKMRKEFKNAKAKHGLNSKKWKRRQIGIRPNMTLLLRPNMTLLLRPKYLLVYKNRRGKAQKRMGEGEKKKKRREEGRRKRSSRKIQRYGF